MSSDHVSGHRPGLFTGQKAAILDLLLSRRGTWLPAYELAFRALQYSARVKELRDAGYVIENRTKHVGRQVHGEFRLVSLPGEADERNALPRTSVPTAPPQVTSRDSADADCALPFEEGEKVH